MIQLARHFSASKCEDKLDSLEYRGIEFRFIILCHSEMNAREFLYSPIVARIGVDFCSSVGV